MPTPTISVGRILQLRVPVAWQESVALAHAAVQKAYDTGARLDLENCLLSTAGTVEVGGIALNPLEGDPFLRLLTLTLDRERAPAELSALVARYENQGHASSEGFASDLLFFARPDPATEISALASRAIAMDLETSAQSLLNGVRAEASLGPPPRSADVPRSRRARRAVVGLAAVALVAALAWTLITARWTPAATASATQAMQSLTTRVDALVDAGLKSAGLTGSVEPPASDTVVVVPSRPEAPRGAPRPPRVVPANTASALPNAPFGMPEYETIVVTASPKDTRIYGNQDPTVDPPALVRPQLPTAQATRTHDPAATYLELEINESGTVDKVRLVSPRSSVRDFMLLSAAKAWVFRSAVKDGRPVKYLLRVPITW